MSISRLALLTAALVIPLAAVPEDAPPKPTQIGMCASPSAPGHLPGTVGGWAAGAQIFPGLGRFHRAVHTSSPEAQAYADQGFRLLWAFNHDESSRSFAKAAMLDPDCGLCWWGVALTLGPNYNFPVLPAERGRVAWEALTRAEALAPSAPPAERALIQALAKRYPGPGALGEDEVGPNLIAYAAAMKQAAQDFPDDLDIATLAAEALMTTNAWRLWNHDGTPSAGTLDVVARLEAVLAKAPDHPGANHYYIHAVEASPHPERGVASAERLRGLVPAAGHLEHMPSHILHRVGRYLESEAASGSGAEADLAYFKQTTAPDYYIGYAAHNFHFEAYSAAMAGRRAASIAAAQKLRALISDDELLKMGDTPEDWIIASYQADLVRFGAWEAILAQPAPNEKLAGLVASAHWARGIAFAATGRTSEARKELDALTSQLASTPNKQKAGLNSAHDTIAIQVATLGGRLALAEGKGDEAVRLLTDAVAKHDQLSYSEPDDWFFPARHLLGAALLQLGRDKEAEAVFQADLQRNPNNGWALSGLVQALNRQHRTAEATAARRSLGTAWAKADIEIASSAY